MGAAGVHGRKTGGRVHLTTVTDIALLELYEQLEPARKGYGAVRDSLLNEESDCQSLKQWTLPSKESQVTAI